MLSQLSLICVIIFQMLKLHFQSLQSHFLAVVTYFMIHSTLYLTLYTLKSMRIFSISVLYTFPMVLAREFVLQ